jgi:hypothetical protein
MPVIRYVLSEYVEHAMAQALYDKLEDYTFAGRIPVCKGVILNFRLVKSYEGGFVKTE